MFLSGKTESKIRFSVFLGNLSTLKPILSTGFPALLRQGLGSLSVLLLNHQAAFLNEQFPNCHSMLEICTSWYAPLSE
jgi:hypothetical protein